MTKTSEVQSHQIHQLTTEETHTLLATASSGLSQDEAQRRLTQNGKNVLLGKNRFPRWSTECFATSHTSWRFFSGLPPVFHLLQSLCNQAKDGRAGMGHFGCHRD